MALRSDDADHIDLQSMVVIDVLLFAMCAYAGVEGGLNKSHLEHCGRVTGSSSTAGRVRLQAQGRIRELALLNLGIDSKLRGCDLVGLKVRDVCHGDQVATRAIVLQRKTQRPVQFEITSAAPEAVHAWIKHAGQMSEDFLFPSRSSESPHLGTRQYARILGSWVDEPGLDGRLR